MNTKEQKNITKDATDIDYRFKFLYALGIVLVVAGHCMGGGVTLLNDWFPVGGYHLGMFMFCSGYFYKVGEEKELAGYIWKKVKRLIIPLYIYNLCYGIFVYLSSFKGFTIGGGVTFEKLFLSPIYDGQQFVYNMAGWYIIPLFMIQIYNVLLRRLLGRFSLPEWTYFVINLALGIGGVYMAYLGYREGVWLVFARMLYFLPFFSLGTFYKMVLEKWDKLPGIWYFSIIFVAKLAIVWVYGKMPIYTPSWCNDFTENPVMPYIVGFLAIAFWLRIANELGNIIGKNKCVMMIANCTYSIMINQFIGFLAVSTCYALIQRVTGLFGDFDWLKYKTDVWYCYMPQNIEHTLIIYLAAGILIPILIQLGINRIKKQAAKFMKETD